VTLDQLRIFIAVAELEHVTQGRIVLTQAGRLFLTEAKAVLGRASAAEKVLTDLAGLTRGSNRCQLLAAARSVFEAARCSLGPLRPPLSDT